MFVFKRDGKRCKLSQIPFGAAGPTSTCPLCQSAPKGRTQSATSRSTISAFYVMNLSPEVIGLWPELRELFRRPTDSSDQSKSAQKLDFIVVPSPRCVSSRLHRSEDVDSSLSCGCVPQVQDSRKRKSNNLHNLSFPKFIFREFVICHLVSR